MASFKVGPAQKDWEAQQQEQDGPWMRRPMYISYLLLTLDPAKVLLDITASFFLLSNISDAPPPQSSLPLSSSLLQ